MLVSTCCGYELTAAILSLTLKFRVQIYDYFPKPPNFSDSYCTIKIHLGIQFSDFRPLPSAIILHPSAISHHPSSLIHQPSAISHQPSYIFHLTSALIHLPSYIFHHPSSLIHLPSYFSLHLSPLTFHLTSTRPSPPAEASWAHLCADPS